MVVSFVTEFRESHENGLVKLLFGTIGVGVGDGPGEICCDGAGGGAPHGTEGRTPERPWREGLDDREGRAGLVSSVAATVSLGR